MKLIKKGIALLLAIMLCLPALSCVAGESVQAADTQQSEFDLLKNIQVISEDFDPQAVVSRGQAAQMLVCLLGLQDQDGGQSSFADVSANDTRSGAIQTAAKFGFLNGYSDGNYYPDKAITMTQAAKMLVSALGYDFTAVQYGGYPGGYLRIAAEKGLLQGISAGQEAELTLKAMVRMFANALEIDLMEQTGFGENTQFTVTKGKNVLTEYHKIEKRKGIVTANRYTGLNYVKRLAADIVQIDGKDYLKGSTKAGDFLGQRVVYYVNTDAPDQETLVSVTPDRSNAVYEVRDNRISEKTSFSQFVFTDDGGKERRMSISPNVDILYNGIADLQPQATDLRPSSGLVKLVDSDGDDTIDVIFVESYETYVVNTVGFQNGTIVDKYNQPMLNISTKDQPDLICNIWRDGFADDIMFLREWDVLSVAKSKDQNFVNLYISTDMAEGTIDAVSDTDGTRTLMVGGLEYEVAPSYEGQLRTGDQGSFFLDVLGRVAGFLQADAAVRYGYLINAGVVSGIGGDVEMRIFDIKNTKAEFTAKAAKNIRIDRKTVKQPEEVVNLLKEAAKLSPASSGIDQIIRYELNQENEISAVDTAYRDEALETEDSLDLTVPRQAAGLTYKGFLFSGAMGISGATTVLLIPEDREKISSYQIKNRGAFSYDGSYKNLEAYDMKEDYVPKLIVQYMESSSESIDIYNALFLVDKIIQGINEDGDAVQMLCGIYNGKYTQVSASEAGQLDEFNLRRGDVVVYNTNSAGEILSMKKVFDQNQPMAFGVSGGNYTGKNVLTYGKVKTKTPNVIGVCYTLDKSGAPDLNNALGYQVSRVSVYDKDMDKVFVSSIDDIIAYKDIHDIEKASSVFIYTYYGVAKDIVVMR